MHNQSNLQPDPWSIPLPKPPLKQRSRHAILYGYSPNVCAKKKKWRNIYIVSLSNLETTLDIFPVFVLHPPLVSHFFFRISAMTALSTSPLASVCVCYSPALAEAPTSLYMALVARKASELFFSTKRTRFQLFFFFLNKDNTLV